MGEEKGKKRKEMVRDKGERENREKVEGRGLNLDLQPSEPPCTTPPTPSRPSCRDESIGGLEITIGVGVGKAENMLDWIWPPPSDHRKPPHVPHSPAAESGCCPGY
ncbi:hypothetical protein V6N13_124896 [Hibiscus sabdariffa]